MSNERLYYIQAVDQWLTYGEAHEYGYTLSKPLLETYYTSDLQPVQIRVDSISGELYDLRAQAPHSWVTDIDSLNLYRLVGDVTLYTADKSHIYTSYSNSISSDESDNIAYNGEIVTYEELYNNFGITKHPCNMYLVQDGRILSWHDPETNLYWDVTKRQWQTYPPSPEQASDDSIIKPFPDPVFNYYQWEGEISQLPTIQSVTGKFFPATSIYTSLSPSQKMVAQWDDYQNLVNSPIYSDVLQIDAKIYVQSENGVDDYQGNHYNYGDYFIGDYQYVYVDSDSDDAFYLGTQRIIFPRSHDDQNPTLYYVDGKYLLPSEVHDLGYTSSISEPVRIFDYSLIEQADSINVILYCKYDLSTSQFVKVKFNYDWPKNWWWACVRQEDLQTITDFGLLVQNNSPWGDNYFGTIGNIVWNKAVTFEITNLYESLDTPVSVDLSQFRLISDPEYSTNLLGIECINKISDQEFIAYKCRITKLNSIEVVLGIRYQPSSGPWLSKTFSDDDWWWSGILSQEDSATVQTFGAGLITQSDTSKIWPGPIGALGYNQNFSYEIVAFYSDLGETEVEFDSNNFYLRGASSDDTSLYPGSVLICSVNSYTTSIMSYKVRITRL